MDIKILKEKIPELKFKKKAEVSVHKKSLISVKKKAGSFHIRGNLQFFRVKKKTERISAEKKTLCKRKAERELQYDGMDAPKENVTTGTGSLSSESTENVDVNASCESQALFQKKKIKAQHEKRKKVIKGVQWGGKAVLNQAEGGEEINTALVIMESIRYPVKSLEKNRLSANFGYKDKTLRYGKKTENQPIQNKLAKKKQTQEIQKHKLQYFINKLTGSGNQDSLWQMAKEILRTKKSVVLIKIKSIIGTLTLPLFSALFMTALSVVAVIMVLYCSPIGAFMENPSDEAPSIQETLNRYFMEFNQSVSVNAGENGAITYLHEQNGSYVSNYMDTLMVYMVLYGTGDLGVVMDEEHIRLLKEVFDEMNSFEDTTITTTIQAGQSLGNVMTSAYCSCPICCGVWSGGPTASGVMPTANHTLAVDSANPFVPIGTKIVMDGNEYVVEDTGNFDRFGVQFDIYFSEHNLAVNWGHRMMEAFLAEGDENTISVTRKGSYVKNLNFEDYIALGKLTTGQEDLLREVMSEEFRSEIPSMGVGSDIASLVLTKVGCQYSQELRNEEGYYDCSSLVQRCYAELGTLLPGIAAEQGQYVVEHGLEAAEDMLEPGDLIFYSYENNGRFRNISHVAVYIGNGRMVHAANTARGVVNDPFSPSNIGLYGRPGQGR